MVANERKARSDLIRVVWTAIKQQKTSAAPATKIKHLLNEAGLPEVDVESLLNDAVDDGLLEASSRISTGPGRNLRKSPTRTYKIPLDCGELIKNLEHDLYCFECHAPSSLQNCTTCPRVFHEQCIRMEANPELENREEASRQSENRNDSGILTTGPSASSNEPMELQDLQSLDQADNTLSSLKTESTSSNEDTKAPGLLAQIHEANDVICVGEVRPPSRKRRLLSSYNKHDITVPHVTDGSQNNDMLCSSCQLQRSAALLDPPIQQEEANYLLKFIFGRIKTWITTDTYSPPSFSNSIPMPSKQELDFFEKKCLKFPKTLDYIDKKLKADGYRTLTEFQCDVMDIRHSIGILYGVQSTEYEACLHLLSDCNFELSEIRKCPDCYRHSNEKSNEYWFCKPCVPRHELVFAKQIGYNHWPAKVIKFENNRYDVRFFGSHHLRAVIDAVHVLPIDTDIKSLKIKQTVSFNKAMDELNIHQELLQWTPGRFSFEAERTNPVDLTGIRPKIQNQKQRGPKTKRSANNSVSLPSDASIDISTTSLNTSTVPTIASTPVVGSTSPHPNQLKRKKNHSGVTEAIDLSSATKRPKPNANSTPLKKRGKLRRNVTNQKNASNDVTKKSQAQNRPSTTIDNRQESTSNDQTNGQESEVSSTQDHSTQSVSKSGTSARIKSKVGKQSKQDVVETLLMELQSLKCPPAACKLATDTLRAEIDRCAERMKRTISETKKKQWCYYCEKEAIYYCCWNTAYCSTECQQKHWQMEHKKTCRRKR